MHQWHIMRDPAEAAAACADYLSARIRCLLADRQLCHVALPGGSTPADCLRRLSAHDLPWERIHWYLGDERCLPSGDGERNDHMIESSLWSSIACAMDNRHPIPAELGAETAAGIYSDLISRVGRLDIALLGMGEDGHTASLFPGNPALEDTRPAVPVHHAPKPPPDRVSLGLSTLLACAERIVLATGEAKQDAIAQVKAAIPLPVNRIGPLVWFVDEDAVGQTPTS